MGNSYYLCPPEGVQELMAGLNYLVRELAGNSEH